MAASDHLHPKQLSMFMPARELYDLPSLDAAGYNGNVETMRRAKRRVNSMSKLGRDVGTEGVRKPVQIVHGSDPDWNAHAGEHAGPGFMGVANGNHRVTAAYDANPDMEVPIEHYDSPNKLYVAMRRQDQAKY